MIETEVSKMVLSSQANEKLMVQSPNKLLSDQRRGG